MLSILNYFEVTHICKIIFILKKKTRGYIILSRNLSILKLFKCESNIPFSDAILNILKIIIMQDLFVMFKKG